MVSKGLRRRNPLTSQFLKFYEEPMLFVSYIGKRKKKEKTQWLTKLYTECFYGWKKLCYKHILYISNDFPS